MNLLCPTDFSNASVNACRWAVQFLDQVGGGNLYILHCIDVVSRSAMFIKLDDIYRERAEEDLLELRAALQPLSDRVTLKTRAVSHDPKSFIADHARKQGYDLVVTGTKGLSALRNMTVGSVTAYLMEHLSTPVLAIPDQAVFRPVRRLVLGVEKRDEVEEAPLQPLRQLLKRTQAELYIAHADLQAAAAAAALPTDPGAPVKIWGDRFACYTLYGGQSVPQALTQFSLEQEADILVMVHRHRAWFSRLFYSSVTKAELFEIQLPLLILAS